MSRASSLYDWVIRTTQRSDFTAPYSSAILPRIPDQWSHAFGEVSVGIWCVSLIKMGFHECWNIPFGIRSAIYLSNLRWLSIIWHRNYCASFICDYQLPSAFYQPSINNDFLKWNFGRYFPTTLVSYLYSCWQAESPVNHDTDPSLSYQALSPIPTAIGIPGPVDVVH